MNNYDRINKAFERAVKQLQENLQYLADNDKVSQKFISMQNAIIKALIDYQQQTELIISSLEMDITGFSIRTGKLREQSGNRIVSLEAICIIHGVTDFPVWLAKGLSYLVNEAVFLQKENTMQLPYQFMKMMEETFTPEEREILEKILYRRMQEVELEKIERLMKEIQERIELLEKMKNAGTQGN